MEINYKNLCKDIAEAYHERNKKRIKRRVEAVAAMFPPSKVKEISVCKECELERQFAKGLCSKCYYQKWKGALKSDRESAK